VEAQEVGVVLLADLVTGQDDDVLGIIAVDEADVLVDGVCSALVPVGALCLLVGGQGVHAAVQAVQIPRLAVADVLIQLLGLILGRDAHSINVGVDAVGQREVHDAVFAAEPHCRFCRFLCQRVQARATSAGKDHCHNFFCHSFILPFYTFPDLLDLEMV